MKSNISACRPLRLAHVVALAACLLFGSSTALAQFGCKLTAGGSQVRHIIYIQFDNVHFTRDNPNVPSDLEQMPHLLNFLESYGTLHTNHHTPLISHTANDILTSLTGVYPDRHGVPIANSFRYFNPDGTTNPGVSFAYWTDPIFDSSLPPAQTDTTFNMLSEKGLNAPAPWVPYTRAGCDVGSVATANTILENITVDVAKVFGPTSPQQQEVISTPALATADFVGIGVHCALGSPVCSEANGGEADLLPDEPKGYVGYSALFGHKYVGSVISPSGPLTDLNGNVIQDPNGNIGFPGFDGMSAAVSLSYVAAMQEKGIPVTLAYISDAHDAHPSGPAYGPGQAGFVAALAAYDDAFNKFFTRLDSDGINRTNTLFVITADENDHFVGGPPSPADCDGINVPCTYAQIGEINTNLTGLLATQQGVKTPFTVHSDDAPAIYITSNPGRKDSSTRFFERAVGNLTAVNPITGNTDALTAFMADPVELKLLHMVTDDPARTPTFVLFGDSNYFFFTGAQNCSSPCVTENPSFAWNHGDVQSDIVTTWLGVVGPGVQGKGVDADTWSDHTDIRPTMLVLADLQDDYLHDGRALVEDLDSDVLPPGLSNEPAFLALSAVYKQINAPVGQLGLDSLVISTRALKSNDKGDKTYNTLEQQLAKFTSRRNSLAGKIRHLLENAEFKKKPLDDATVNDLISQANSLLTDVHNLATE
ncbi:MAG TPA: hypothetical protein VLT90_09050 [Terriglobales bacterium]|nr:hypothetical protein [Terriglobales bacterium]